jgi:hypothetical protein
MKVARVAVLIALIMAPAYAQVPDINLIPETRSKTPEEIERDRQIERAYKDSLRKIPDAKGADDPWGAMRSSASPAASHAKKPHAARSKPKSSPHAHSASQ